MKAICIFIICLGVGFFAGFKVSNDGQSGVSFKLEKSTEGIDVKFLKAKETLVEYMGGVEEFYTLATKLKLDASGCQDVEAELLPNFLVDKNNNSVKLCKPKAILEDSQFDRRLAFEFLEVNGICEDYESPSLEEICDKKDTNDRYFPDRILASVKEKHKGKNGKRSFTVTIDYGDKTSVFMVIDKQSKKLAYKTNYGNEKMVPLDEMDVEYMTKQVSRISRKLVKPKCKRKIIRLFAFDKNGQRFRSFACIEDLNSHTQKLLKLSRTLSSLSQGSL